MENRVLKTLSVWFMIHFIIDVIVAIPLLFFPNVILTLLGWYTVDPVTSRIAAAALFAIGIQSYIGRKGSIHEFRTMLNLKIIWSGFAVFGILLSILEGSHGRPVSIFVFLFIFIFFNIIWIFYRFKLEENA